MNLKKTSFLALFLLVLLGYLYFFELPKDEAVKTKRDPLASLTDSEISSVTIKNSSEVFTITQSKPSSEKKELSDDEFAHWSFVGWEGVPVDGKAIKSFLSSLRNLGIKDPLPKEEIETDRTIYGLHAPSIEVTISGDAIKKTLIIGKEVEFLSKKYAQFLDSPFELYLLPVFKIQEIEKKKEDLRLKNFFDFTEPKLKEISYSFKGNEVTLQKEEKGWVTLGAQKYKASSEKVSAIIKEIQEITSSSIVGTGKEVSEASFGLNEPHLKISVKDNDGKITEIRLQRRKISEPENKMGMEAVVFSTNLYPGVISEFKSNPSERIALLVSDLRDKKLSSFTQFDIKKATIEESGKAPVVIALEGKEWSVDGQKGDSVFISDYFSKISSIEAVSFIDGEALQGTPLLKLTLELESGNKSEIFVEKLSDERILFRGEAVGVISEDALKTLVPKKDTLLSGNKADT